MASISDFFLHMPLWMAGLIAIVGVSLFWSGNKRQDNKLQRVGAGIFFLGIVFGVIGMLYLSDGQKMDKRSRGIVSAVDKRDWNTLNTLLDDHSALGTEQTTIAANRAEIVSLAKEKIDQFGVKSISVLSTQVTQTQTLITVSMEIVSTQGVTQDRPVTSSWQFDYEEMGQGWMLQKMTLTRVGQEKPQDILGRLIR